MGQSGGRRLDSDVRQLHRRVRPLRGSWGSRQLSSTERVYPSPRASTNLSATLSSHNLGCNDVFATTTTAGAPMHSNSGGHPSGHVYSNTSSRRAQPGGVLYPALTTAMAARAQRQSSRLCTPIAPTALFLPTTTETTNSSWRGRQRGSRRRTGQPRTPGAPWRQP
jgi:hypothetical protein